MSYEIFSRRFIVGACIFFIAFSTARAAARRPPLPHKSINVLSDGNLVSAVEAYEVEEKECLSLADIQRIFGGRRKWERVSRRVIYNVNGRTAEFTLDQSSAIVMGKTVNLGSPVRWWTGQPYIPVSFIASSEFQSWTDARVMWTPSRRDLKIVLNPDLSPRLSPQGDGSRAVFDLAGHVGYKILKTRKEKEILLRFSQTRPRPYGEKLEWEGAAIKSLEIIPRGRDSDAVIVLSEKAGTPSITFQSFPRQVIVDVSAAKETAPPLSEKSSVDTVLPSAGDTPWSEKKNPSPFWAMSPLRTIFLDPGHGGKDAGALGPRGTMEKDVNLVLAKDLAKRLRDEGRYRVLLTRDDDSFVPLERRTEFANNNKADLFISIHCNAALSSRSNGVEIYFMSEKATDDDAAAVARRENAVVELEGISGQAKYKVQQLLWSLAKAETLNESSEIAALVAKEIGRRMTVVNRGVKQAGFYVLKGAAMPAVLVESGFITHPKEEKLLMSSVYQDKLTQSILAGIINYEKRKISAHVNRPATVGDN